MLEHSFAWCLAKQQARGVWVDQAMLRRLTGALMYEREKLRKSWEAYAPYTRRHEHATDKAVADWEAASGRGWFEEYETPKTHKFRARFVSFNPGSRSHLIRLLKERYAWKPRAKTETGLPRLDEGVLKDLTEWSEAKLALEQMLIQKRLGQVAEGPESWVKHLGPDGRIHGRVNHNGTVTGRCVHSAPNTANVPAVDAPWGAECRAVFAAPGGYLMVGADASSLELRCLAHYMAQWDKGEYAKVVLEGDIHAVNQEIMGLPTRQLSKLVFYATCYGASDKKLSAIIGGNGGKARAKLMRGLPAFGALVSAVRRSAERGYLYGLDGRRLRVRSPHSALNTLLQSAGALVMKKATVMVREALLEQGLVEGVDDALRPLAEGTYDFAQVLHVHDEIQFEVREGSEENIGREAVKAIHRAGQSFGFRCPLDGEWKVGQSWAETH